MASTNSYDITITNFDKFKGRADVTHNSWFRLSNRFLEDPDFFDFTAEEKLVWIYLLSIASQKNESKFSVNLKHAEKICSINSAIFQSSLEKLNHLKCLSFDVTPGLRDLKVTSESRALHNITEQDITEHNNSLVVSSDRLPTKSKRQTYKVSTVQELAQILSNPTKESYLQLYGGDKEFIKREFYKILNWLEANQKKNLKTVNGWQTFVSNWLERGWPKYQNNQSSNNPKASTVEDLMNFMGWDNA